MASSLVALGKQTARGRSGIVTLEGHSNHISACAYAPDGRRIISGWHYRTLRVWDAKTGACLNVLKGHSESVIACVYAPDGRRIVSSLYDKTLRVWDAEDGRLP